MFRLNDGYFIFVVIYLNGKSKENIMFTIL